MGICKRTMDKKMETTAYMRTKSSSVLGNGCHREPPRLTSSTSVSRFEGSCFVF